MHLNNSLSKTSFKLFLHAIIDLFKQIFNPVRYINLNLIKIFKRNAWWKKTKQIILLCVKLFYIIYLVFRCHCGEILTEHVVISNAHNNTDCLVPGGKCFLLWNTLYNLGGFYSTIKQWSSSSIKYDIIIYMICSWPYMDFTWSAIPYRERAEFKHLYGI